MSAFAPTAEQEHALALFATGKSLAIEAGAGTGKTSTLKLLAESTPRRGQYIAFNKAIVEEAKAKMPSTVSASTAHSLAYRNIVVRHDWMANRLRHSARMKSTEIASRLRIEQINLTLQDDSFKRLHASYLAGLTMRAIIRFCQSADPEPTWQHVPYIDGIDLPPGARDNNRIVARQIEGPMRKAWADITDSDGTLPFRHDHYLKLWHLDDPHINADYILFDEAQDANPVLVDIIRRQAHHLTQSDRLGVETAVELGDHPADLEASHHGRPGLDGSNIVGMTREAHRTELLRSAGLGGASGLAYADRRAMRLEVLRDLLTYTEAGIELDSDALRELIAEVEAATEPVALERPQDPGREPAASGTALASPEATAEPASRPGHHTEETTHV